MSSHCPPELRERAVRMIGEISGQHDSERAAISEVARYSGWLWIADPTAPRRLAAEAG